MNIGYDFLFKCIVIGDGGVGKTALAVRFAKGYFTEDYKVTIGIDFHLRNVTVETAEGPKKARLQIWDTAGQERFDAMRPTYYHGAFGALVVFDLTSNISFTHLQKWIKEVKRHVKKDIPVILIGNKNDLIDQKAVSQEQIEEFTKKFGLRYMETSAKTGAGVTDVNGPNCFDVLASLMVEHEQKKIHR
ncbi:MAG: GTP-binding protein [Candidatus Hodarchaeota archaeon]